MLLLSHLALAAPPSVRVESPDGVLWGTERLHVERDGRESIFDFHSQVHLPESGLADPDVVDLRLLAVSGSRHFDRVASLWMVLAEQGEEQASLSAWIGVLEPGRARLAGFPVDGMPATLSLSGDGEVVAWAGPDGVHVASLVPPARPALVFERDVDPPLFDTEPMMFADLDLLDWAFDGPDLSLELFDLVDLVVPIEEDVDDEPEARPEPAPPERGAQRLRADAVVIDAPPGKGDAVLALSHRGQEVAVAVGPHLALWTVGAGEARCSGSLEREVKALEFVDGRVRVTLAGGAELAVGGPECSGLSPES